MNFGAQPSLFDFEPQLPEGFRYQPGFLTIHDEADLIARFGALPFQPFQWHGYEGNRRTVSFDWSYHFEKGLLAPATSLPDFLITLRARAEEWASLPKNSLVQGLVTQYPPGAGIGWHRDAPPFGVVIGISLLSDCRFQLRHQTTGAIRNVPAGRRSIYALTGEARSVWQHGIPGCDELRYSITFRTLR